MAIEKIEHAPSRRFTLHHALPVFLSVGWLLLASCGKKEAPPETQPQPAPQQPSSQPYVSNIYKYYVAYKLTIEQKHQKTQTAAAK